MKKKAANKKITEKAKKKELEKKVKTALRSPKKTTTKKKEIKVKKVLVEKVKKIEIPKPALKPTKKVKAKVKAKEKPKKAVVKAEKKVLPEAVEKVEKKKITKITEKKVEVEVKEKEPYPAIEAKYPPTPWEALPTEYGENGITLMTVDPYKLFAFWEVREDTLKIFKGDLSIRVYDVTGIDFDRMDANSYFDIPVSERIGKLYIDVSPAKEFIADIGIMYEGIFITIARSNKISTPYAEISEEGLLPQKLYETGLCVGY